MNLADIRQSYERGELRRADLLPDPFAQFDRWMADATAAGVVEPTAMSLATGGADGVPRVRTVLLKGLDARGFVFYTNRESRKGRALTGKDARASLLFPWLALERQVLVAGTVSRVSDEEAGRYFASRPYDSRLSAWASSQSHAVGSRGELEEEFAGLRARFAAPDGGEGEVPLPPFWGGFRVRPETVEFWQGRPNRLHDRFEYTRLPDGDGNGNGGWKIERLAP